MQEQIRNQKLTDDIKNLNCKRCNKYIVCTLIRGLNTLINNNWSGEAKPFESENVAMICKHFFVEQKLNL